MDQRGQASSVFNLLIAAVVAIAILALLIQILGGIGGINKEDAVNESSNALKNSLNQTASPQVSKEVTWSRETSPVTARNIALKSGEIDESHLCLHLGKFEGDGSWNNQSGSDGAILQYTGSSNIKTKIVAYCDTCNGNGNGFDLSSAGSYLGQHLSDGSGQVPSACSNVPGFSGSDDGTCCVVALLKT